MEEATEFCKICDTASSKYCCPRCNILYCSLACYKSDRHLQCSESFYKENVIQEMALSTTKKSTMPSHNIADMFKRLDNIDRQFEDEIELSEDDEDRFEEIDSDDDEGRETAALAERLGGIDLNDPDAIWERLTDEERREFQGMLESGDISKVLPEVEPWWTVQHKVELVQPVSDVPKGLSELVEQCPPVKRNIKDFATISSKEPSPLTRYNLINILAAYGFVFRYFNGDLEGSSREAANCIIAISDNLKKNTVYESESLAVESVCHVCREEQLPADKHTSLLLKEDVKLLLSGPAQSGVKYRKHFLLAALSDVHRLLKSVKGEPSKPEATEKSEKGAFSRIYSDDNSRTCVHLEPVKLRTCLKKIEYMLSYVKDCL